MTTIKIDITPIAKPRMTRSDKWRKKNHKNPKYEIRACVEKYWAFKNELLKKAMLFKLGDAYEICFVMPFPKSYSKKKQKELWCTRHKVKPDLDNMIKAINDCFCKNDSHIHQIKAKKIWGLEGHIIITNL